MKAGQNHLVKKLNTDIEMDVGSLLNEAWNKTIYKRASGSDGMIHN